MKTNTGKKPSNKKPEAPGRTKGKNAGPNSGKTRSPMPATQDLKAASGKARGLSRFESKLITRPGQHRWEP